MIRDCFVVIINIVVVVFFRDGVQPNTNAYLMHTNMCTPDNHWKTPTTARQQGMVVANREVQWLFVVRITCVWLIS